MNTTSGNSTSTDFFGGLLATFKVSKQTLIIIGSFVLLGFLIIVLVIACIIYRCCQNKEGRTRKKRTEVAEKNIFGDDAEKYESKYGYIDISVTYDRRRKKLIIRDIQANNLMSPSTEAPDCFLKVYMKNSKGKIINTKTTKPKVDNYTPFFSDTFTFSVDSVKDALVYFQVIDDNPNGNDIVLGIGTLDMSKLGMDSYIGVISQTYVILEKPQGKEGKGDICIILSWRNNSQRIVVLEAKDLVYKYSKTKYVGYYEHPWVYATVTIYINKARKRRFQTKKLFNTENPYFLETFDAVIKGPDLTRTCIKITLFETLPPKVTRKIGRVFIGNPDMNPLINAIGKFHWDLACSAENQPKAMWHSLQFS